MDDFICFEIDFGVGLLCKEEVLGNSFDIHIYELQAKVEFPRLHPLLTNETYCSYKDLIAPSVISNNSQNICNWGEVVGYERIISVNKALLTCAINENQNFECISGNREIILKAIVTLLDHLEIISKQPFVHLISQSVNVFRFQNARIINQTKRINTPHMLSKEDIMLDQELGISFSEVEKAIQNYNNHEIPLAFQLLNEARKLFYQQKYRSTVFECASAVEVLITSELDKYFKINSNQSAERKYKKCSGLTCKFKIAKSLSLYNKEYDLNILTQLRNHAIHAGNQVGIDEAVKVLEITDDFIYSEITHLF